MVDYWKQARFFVIAIICILYLIMIITTYGRADTIICQNFVCTFTTHNKEPPQNSLNHDLPIIILNQEEIDKLLNNSKEENIE